MVKVDLIYFEAGGGHYAAAQALELALREHYPWQVRLLNLQELLLPIDFVCKLTGIRTQDVYNRLLARDCTRTVEFLLPILHLLVRLGHAGEVRLIEDHWRADPPNLAVSLVPHFNRALAEALRTVAPTSPFVTILTDLADYPPHFWIERQDQFVVCGSRRAVRQARDLGIDPERVFRTSGIILHPRFYQSPGSDRRVARQRLGFDPDLPLGLVTFGGSGSSAMLDLANRLEECAGEIQVVSICGRNESLAESLRRRRRQLRHLVIGYTTEVQRYMYVSDFFIGKPGPGSLSEAIAMNLPVIVERSQRTMPQERYNVDWILENELGVVVPNFRLVAEAVREIVKPENLARLRANAAKIRNRAVFEIPGILESIISPVASRSHPSTRHGS
jgi:Glycosyltransferase family 28 C-terminal domain